MAGRIFLGLGGWWHGRHLSGAWWLVAWEAAWQAVGRPLSGLALQPLAWQALGKHVASWGMLEISKFCKQGDFGGTSIHFGEPWGIPLEYDWLFYVIANWL